MYTKKQRLSAFILCAFFVLSSVFSFVFVVKEANHKCSHTDCQICQTIDNILSHFKRLGNTDNTAAVAATSFFAIVILLMPFGVNFLKLTPVELRDKLTN